MLLRLRARTFSTQNYPLLRTLFGEFVKKRRSPCFELHSSQIQILYQPIDYYLALNVPADINYRRGY